MSLVVSTNISSLAAQRSLNEVDREMKVAMERLSTGQRINGAADDAAGLAVSQRMEAQIGGLNQAIRNTQDGLAMVDTIEASMNEGNDILQRMRTLAAQAATDTTSAADRTLINNEITALKNELTRMADSTRFGDQKVLDGNFSGKLIQTGANQGETVSLSVNSIAAASLGGFQRSSDVNVAIAGTNAYGTHGHANTETFTITPSGGSATAAIGGTAGLSAKEIAVAVNNLSGTTGVTAVAKTFVKIEFAATQTYSLTIGSDEANTTVALSDFAAGAADVTAAVAEINKHSSTTGFTATNRNTFILLEGDGRDLKIENRSTNAAAHLDTQSVEFDGTTLEGNEVEIADAAGADHGLFSGTFQLRSSSDFAVTGAAGSPISAGATASNANLDAISGISVTSQSGAASALETIDGAIGRLASYRADLGALSNRLEHSIDRMMVTAESTEAAKSVILDTNFSAESANLAKAQVLQQVGTAMLAQANAQPQLVLQLLQ